MKIAFRLVLLFFILSSNLWASTPLSAWYTLGPDKKATLNVQLFLASTCPHCHKADEFFQSIAADTPYLNIQRNVINEDKNALFRLNQLLTDANLDDFSVPAIYFCNSHWVGFASAETTGKDLLKAINYCKQQIEKNGELTQATVDTLEHWANANRFDAGMVEAPSAFRYMMTIAIIDAFGPCALFCFACFLALLWIEEDRKKQLKAGVLFIVALGIMHYFQRAHASSFYELLPWLRIPAALLGLATVYFVVQCYKRQANTKWYFVLAFLLGLIIVAYQQTCMMNWSYIFEQWLSNQKISSGMASLYQLFYQLVYVLPLILLLFIYLFALKTKRMMALKPRLFTISLLIILGTALCLIVYPLVLAHFAASFMLLCLLIVCGCFLNLT